MAHSTSNWQARMLALFAFPTDLIAGNLSNQRPSETSAISLATPALTDGNPIFTFTATDFGILEAVQMTVQLTGSGGKITTMTINNVTRGTTATAATNPSFFTPTTRDWTLDVPMQIRPDDVVEFSLSDNNGNPWRVFGSTLAPINTVWRAGGPAGRPSTVLKGQVPA